MVKEDILRGLQIALAKGESLEQAMYSFYNAGYKKEEVEEAARALQITVFQQSPSQPIQKPIQPVKPIQPIQKIQQPKVVQTVSKYEKNKSKIGSRTITIIILSVLLVLLLSVLMGIFLFRESLLGFFNSLF